MTRTTRHIEVSMKRMNIHTRGCMMNKIGKINPFWDDEYKYLSYRKEPFNNPKDLEMGEQGYTQPVELFTGTMCKHGEGQPSWTPKIVEWLEKDLVGKTLVLIITEWNRLYYHHIEMRMYNILKCLVVNYTK